MSGRSLMARQKAAGAIRSTAARIWGIVPEPGAEALRNHLAA
jgi:hypothetical protein